MAAHQAWSAGELHPGGHDGVAVGGGGGVEEIAAEPEAAGLVHPARQGPDPPPPVVPLATRESIGREGTDPRDPAEGRGCRVMRPPEERMTGTPRPDPISTRRRRIAELARKSPQAAF